MKRQFMNRMNSKLSASLGVKLAIAVLMVFGSFSAAWAAEVYQAPAEFVAEAFNGEAPKAKKLWITKSLRKPVTNILGHAPNALRVSYWGKGNKTAWVLEEIGKEQPITVGVLVENDKIEQLKVLIYRESRGWEVRHPFFTEQFYKARLEPDHQLDRQVDGITGATLSVEALKKIARLALYLHHQTDFTQHESIGSP